MQNINNLDFPQKLANELWTWVENKRSMENRPHVIYHFTDIEGMIGIYNERTLWATHASSLNDVTEILYGIDIAKKHVLARLNPLPNATSIPHVSLPAKYNDILEAVYKFLGEPSKEYETFVISFCGNIDKSMHWLHYGRGGKGVALGFDPSVIEQGGFLLFPIEYDKSKFERFVDDVMTKVQEVLDKCHMVDNSDAIDSEGRIVSSFFKLNAIRFKDECFSGEEEWRLIRWMKASKDNSFRTNFRALNNRVIPYIKLNFRMPSLKEIVLGHSSSMNKDDEGLTMLVGEGTDVRKSNVPVR
jgi:hypothetical protein